MCALLSRYRVYIERDDLQSLKLYITDIVTSDAGEYECRGEVEGTPEVKAVVLELYGKCVVGGEEGWGCVVDFYK